MSLVTFTDPTTSTTYTWENNPIADAEQQHIKQRQISRTSNTANVGVVKQQGDDGPLIFDWTVNVFTSGFELALWEWYETSRHHTIYVADWDGEEYEGQIIQMGRTRKAASQQFAQYQIQFEVYRFISGPMATAGVTP